MFKNKNKISILDKKHHKIKKRNSKSITVVCIIRRWSRRKKKRESRHIRWIIWHLIGWVRGCSGSTHLERLGGIDDRGTLHEVNEVHRRRQWWCCWRHKCTCSRFNVAISVEHRGWLVSSGGYRP